MSVINLKKAKSKRTAEKKAKTAHLNPLEKAALQMDELAGIPLAWVSAPDLSGITRICGAQGCANDTGDDEIVMTAEAKKFLTAYCEHFGFDRLPRTIGELGGLLHYGEALYHYSWRWLRVPGLPPIKEPRTRNLERFLEIYPECEEALRLYTADEFAKLKKHHTQTRRMEALAKHYKEFVADGEEDPLAGF
jgi:hypothetical protein